MRRYLLTILLVLSIACQAYCQDQSLPLPSGQDPTSTVNYYEILDSRINFYSVDNHYQLVTDSIYYIDRAGFIINLGWDSVKIDNDFYIILTYPNYKSKVKNSRDQSDQIQ